MTSRPDRRGISMSTTTRSTGSLVEPLERLDPVGADRCTSASSARSICDATIWLVGLSSASRMRTPASRGVGRGGGRRRRRDRVRRSAAPPGRRPSDRSPISCQPAAEAVGQRPGDAHRRARPARLGRGRRPRAGPTAAVSVAGHAEDDLAAAPPGGEGAPCRRARTSARCRRGCRATASATPGRGAGATAGRGRISTRKASAASRAAAPA